MPVQNEIDRPFLKWAGNKFHIVDRIREVLPAGRRLVEPFVGSGALFLNVQFDEYLLADANPDLISLFDILRSQRGGFVDYARSLFSPTGNSEAVYYELRSEFNSTTDATRKAALFIYLNRHCFNGLCRYNSRGEFNVPFGRYSKPYFPERELLRFADKLHLAEIRCEDFGVVMQSAREGDVLYCDPPYVPLSNTAQFTSYSRGGFNDSAQERLAREARALSARGVPVLISNHDTPFTREAYSGAQLVHFDVKRFISRDAANRNAAPELLALFSANQAA